MPLTEAEQDYLGEALLVRARRRSSRRRPTSPARSPSRSRASSRWCGASRSRGLIGRDAKKHLLFTDEGREVAHRVVSRHRLLEAFLTEVFEIPWDEVHEEAHSLEHRLSASVERRMYAMMADVRACPHGHPIGDAPREAGEPLSLIPTGSTVTLLRFENEDADLLRRFRVAGLEPGARYAIVGVQDGAVSLARGGGETRARRAARPARSPSASRSAATAPPPRRRPATGAQAALLGETAWGM